MFINSNAKTIDVSGSVIEKFADETKWAIVVESDEEKNVFQQGLDRSYYSHYSFWVQ